MMLCVLIIHTGLYSQRRHYLTFARWLLESGAALEAKDFAVQFAQWYCKDSQAWYCLGVINEKLQLTQEALQAFSKYLCVYFLLRQQDQWN